MAHERKRHIHALFNSYLKFAPIVGIFGHRQVGKSTFIASLIKEYRTLDNLEELTLAHENPKKFISSAHPMAIDECQLEPRLFPALKEWVRTNKRPGQFILSGSVRFTSRKAIRESLAGRMAILEMLPFSASELAELPLNETVTALLSHSQFSTDSLRCLHQAKDEAKIERAFSKFLNRGGLPGICFIREPSHQQNTLNDLHDLMLGRDLQLVSDLKTPILTMKRLLSHIASLGFQAYNASEVSRKLGLAASTQKNLLFALESIFLIRRIPLMTGKREVFLLEDQYEEWYYSGFKTEKTQQIETAVYRNLRTQLAYQPNKNSHFETYLTRDGARVPIVIHGTSRILGIIVTQAEKPSLSETRSAASFLKNHASGKILYLTDKRMKPNLIDERSLHCSIYSVI